MAAEQLQWMPFVNPKLHMPLVRLLYWCVRQLDSDIKVNPCRYSGALCFKYT